ncbi:aminotransferase class I/II-fold pyridoxal phosphate-dependent enzyme [Actinomadura rubrisoli]|uniref:aminotransferase class I/II-fold pyridoxal phosphate-dependent enzyme n=1 Tax=Actinomadura rubrisoli TaxID=2530368 RepID=UPI001A9FF69D|nr:aminotransferase class I/II-fold pyridoxal phosphate-dependent enzyme [Actinomadura rubrisoli]
MREHQPLDPAIGATGRTAEAQGHLPTAFARLARARTSPAVWDFIEGGAGEERTVAANRRAFDEVALLPRVLGGVTEPDTTVRVLDRIWRAPIAVAPLAYQTLLHPEGELATVRGAMEAGAPVIVSTFAGRRLEDLAADAAGAPLWLQLYCFRDRDITQRLVARAEEAGFEALVLTVDAPRLGRRGRDPRNEFRLPPGVVPANLPSGDYASPWDHARLALDPALDWTVIDWIRSISSLPVLVKGVLSPADAALAVGAGVDGLVVSNHGGRQLDGAPATLRALPAVVEAVAGRCPVLLDGGVRRGGDVLAAVALGAAGVLVGRPVLHALAAGGGDGVAAMLEAVVEDLVEAMVLTGTASIANAGPDLIATPGTARIPGPRPGRRALNMSGNRNGELQKAELHPSLSDPMLETMNFLNEIVWKYPDAISFAPGRPFPGFFDVEQVFGATRRYLRHLAERGDTPDEIRESVYQYGPAAGQIRELIAASLAAEEGMSVAPESIVVTVGCQEALVLALRALFAGPDDVLLVASPCYVGLTGAARLLDIPILTVPETVDGLSATDLDSSIRAELSAGRRPRACYVVPDHSNPSGSMMPLQARRDLLDVAARYGVLILEDSPYRLVSAGQRLPTLKALDRHRVVVHIGSYSKTLFPGARVGFVVADQAVHGPDGRTGLLADELAKVKSMITVNTPSLSQAAVAGMLLEADHRPGELNRPAAAHYKECLQTMLGQFRERFPPERAVRLGVEWNEPSGGFFLSLRVPFQADNAALSRSADRHGVIWTPMSYFYPDGGGERTIRLSFSYLTPALIKDGMTRLVEFIETESAAGFR